MQSSKIYVALLPVQNFFGMEVWNGIWNGRFLVWNRRKLSVWNKEKSVSITFHTMPCRQHKSNIIAYQVNLPVFLFFFTLNTISCFILSWDVELKVVEAVKFLWKQKRKHFDERDCKRKRTRKRLILSGAGSGSKKFQRLGSRSELWSIKLQEKLEAFKIRLLPHPWSAPTNSQFRT